jgi:N-acyl-phosphatidylethanolamine-hydrolysing phospholipase D
MDRHASHPVFLMSTRRIFHLAISIVISLALPGCIFGRFVKKNIEPLASTPKSIPNKITNSERKDARLAVLWIGHATTLIQIDDKFILTDPVFTSTVGMLSKRIVEPGIDVQNLPTIDAVLISHMHFDHLSLPSLDMIAPKVRRAFVPRGGLVYAPNESFDTFEIGPFQTWSRDGLEITAVPNVHVGWRYGADAAWMTAFTAYVIRYHGITVYFGGDTAYVQEKFQAVHRAFPHIDLALLPIAPIRPRALMERTHEDPAGAMHAFLDLHADRMMPIHFETFVNSTDEIGDARKELEEMKTALRFDDDRVPILHVGDQHVFISKSSSAAR